jgi:probable addiction module antidote protein
LNGPRFEIKRHEVNKNKFKTRTFDVTNYLHNELDVAAYLRAVIKDGDQDLLAAALGDAARVFGKTQLTNNNALTKKVFKTL